MSLFAKLKNELKTARQLLYYRLMSAPKTERETVDAFHKLYYAPDVPENRTWHQTRWMGVKILKCPLDLWIYQEIFWELKPDLILETGTAHGGSALYMASLCDLLGRGRIVSVDIEPNPSRPVHPRIQYITGSSVDPAILEKVGELARGAGTVVVILDSDHRRDHVAKELAAYSGFVTKGSYLIVEDSNVNGHPVSLDHGPGPMEALEEFLAGSKDFVVDQAREKFYLTFNPKGYLKRIH